MRVLHVHSGNLYGGVETLVVTLARDRDLCPSMEPHFALCFQGRLSQELAAVGAKVHFLGKVRVRQPLSVLRARRALQDVLRVHQIDIAICHSAWPQAIFGPIVRRAGLPLVFWLHSAINGRHWLERWASLTPPDLAVCVNHFAAATLRSMYGDARAQVVYSPVAPPGARLSDTDRLAVRTELNTPRDATVIIQASRMEMWKGHLLHLEALSKLQDLPDWVCWQAGGPQRPCELPYFQTLKETAVRLGIGDRVRFLGQRTDVARLLAAADIYCQPNNRPEGTPITFIEALYAGLPVVTTQIGGFKEIVDGSCGAIVPTSHPQALAETLRQFIENPDLRHRLGCNGPTQARKLCDPTSQIMKIDQLLHSALR